MNKDRVERAITSLFAMGWVLYSQYPVKLTNGARIALVKDNGDAVLVE